MKNNINKTLKGYGIGGKKGSGRVVHISSYVDFDKIQGGEVVVTKCATPDYIVILKKISCLITDEGGFTSHTAIICRELNIPAILGTSFATQHLKNDNCVMYDTSKGECYYD